MKWQEPGFFLQERKKRKKGNAKKKISLNFDSIAIGRFYKKFAEKGEKEKEKNFLKNFVMKNSYV